MKFEKQIKIAIAGSFFALFLLSNGCKNILVTHTAVDSGNMPATTDYGCSSSPSVNNLFHPRPDVIFVEPNTYDSAPKIRFVIDISGDEKIIGARYRIFRTLQKTNTSKYERINPAIIDRFQYSNFQYDEKLKKLTYPSNLRFETYLGQPLIIDLNNIQEGCPLELEVGVMNENLEWLFLSQKYYGFALPHFAFPS
jgi:hypothetical protein